MKATEFLKDAVEQYRNEVSGEAVAISVPELGLDFHVFPVQAEETKYLFSDPEALQFDHIFAIKLICGRAKKENGASIFDSKSERDTAEAILMKTAPKSFTAEVANRVITEITEAFPVTSVEEAGNELEDATSSDSTSTLQKNETAQSTT